MNTHPWFSKDVYDLDQSLRFEDGRLAYLSRLPESAGNRRTWTYSSWVKRGNIATSEFPLLAAKTDANNRFYFRFEGNVLKVYWNVAGTSNEVVTTAVYRDPSAWYHVVLAVDTTQSTAANRIKIYVNGVQQTLTGTYIPEDTDTQINLNVLQVLGKKDTANTFYDGYLAELHLIDGTALGPNSFGTTGENGGWIPKAYPGAHGTNGFYLPFKADYTVEGFSTVTYRGRNGGQYIGGVGFSPDLLWIKCRNYNEYPFFVDSIRGAGKELKTLNTEAESSNGFVTSFQSDGFVLLDNDGPANRHSDGGTFVAWSWDMGGSNATLTAGSINSVVRANPTYGQSIVSYTGNATAGATVAHGLSSVPEMIIIKNRTSAKDWYVYHVGTDADDPEDFRLLFNDAAAVTENTTGNSLQGTAPTDSVFTLGNGTFINENNSAIIAYCWHSVTGYSKFGSYTGNGNATGTTVTLGFRPAFIMLKPSSAADHWNIYDTTRDTTNPIDTLLFANRNNVEGNGQDIEISDTGFQLKTTNTGSNGDGTTYVYMAFADTREYAYWLDQSGNNNDWQSNNLTESDVMVDSPSNNFPTWNPIGSPAHAELSYSEGNLRTAHTGTNDNTTAVATMLLPSSGKYYWEIQDTTGGDNYLGVGLNWANQQNDTSILVSEFGWAMRNNGTKYTFDAGLSYGGSYGDGDIVGIAVDLDNSKIWFGINNDFNSQGSGNPSNGTGAAYTNVTGDNLTIHCSEGAGTAAGFIVNFGQDSSFTGTKPAQGNQDANGIGDFYYAPPTGFLALCTNNLPEPAVVPSNHFNTVLYTGNGTSGSSTQAITVGFQPDLTWLKIRTGQADSNSLTDSVRGVSLHLRSDTTNADVSEQHLSSFDSAGFTLLGDHGQTNYNNFTYVAWNWKAGNANTAFSESGNNPAGTHRANVPAGFSIVSYVGTGAAGTVAHGLSAAPEWILIKNRDETDAWAVYYGDNTDYLVLNTTAATADAATYWGDTSPTASVFTVGAANSADAENYIAYCFHSVDGYSKLGSYTGNGNADGPFINTGFRPAWVMVKRANSSENWPISDNTRSPHNAANAFLRADESTVETTGAMVMDFTANGFKMRNTDTKSNANGDTYIYLAFAETPFKFSSAR